MLHSNLHAFCSANHAKGKMKNFWIKKQRKYAEMRLGGMTPASLYIELPANYKWLKKTIYSFNGVTIFCHECEQSEAELSWVDDFKVKLRGQLATNLGYQDGEEIDLVHSPSYRTRWVTFTVPEKK